MRTIVLVIGLLFAGGALFFAACGRFPAAAMLAVWAFIFLGALAFERWRYKRLSITSPGAGWQATEERFVDPETGKLVTVYIHPTTGERRYVAA